MDKDSKIIFGSLLFLIAASAAFTYYRTMVLHDYPVINETAESEELLP